MKAMVLAAGRGERLAPLTDYLPKPLFPVLNKPIIEYTLELLANFGITEVVINLYHLGEKIEQRLGDGSRFGLKISYSYEDFLLGTGGGLKKVEKFFDDEEVFLLLNGDTLIDINLLEVIKRHTELEADATVVLTTLADRSIFGGLGINKQGFVVEIGNKVLLESEQVSNRYVFAGVHVLTPKIFEFLPPLVSTCIVNYGYRKLITNGGKVGSYIMRKGYWNDLGTPERFFKTNMELLKQSVEFEFIDPYSRFRSKQRKSGTGFIGMGESVNIGDMAQFIPPVVVGDNVDIGNETVIGPFCCIGDGATVKKRTALAKTVVLPDSEVPARSRFEDAIIAGKHITYITEL